MGHEYLGSTAFTDDEIKAFRKAGVMFRIGTGDEMASNIVLTVEELLHLRSICKKVIEATEGIEKSIN